MEKTVELTRPSPALARRLKETTGVDVMACFQCGKCSAGCPIGDLTDMVPHNLVRLVQLGALEELLASHHIWLCVSCETCTSRCPNEVDVARLIDGLREAALSAGVPPAEPNIPKFHQAFLESVRRGGRVHELDMIRRYKMSSGELTKDVGMGLKMFMKGKIKILGEKIKGQKEVERLFEQSRR
jgi:heterodisulfide reductase subunit C